MNRMSPDGPFPDGEMGRLVGAYDWSATPLGPIAGWPQGLAVAVRIMLGSRYAMWLGWGPDLIFFYNDAYARMTLGAKHPWALGRSVREVWAEIWPDVGPRAESVLATGTATWDEGLRLFLERRGFTEETYHTFSYSPLPDDSGGVGGLLCVVTEDTERAIGERRLRTLRELAARTAEATRTTEDAVRAASAVLTANPHDLPFVLFYLINPDTRTARLEGAVGLPPGSPAAPATVDLAVPVAEPAGWPLRTVLETGRVEVVTGIERWLGPVPVGVYPEPPHTAAVIPLRKPGQDRLAGFLVAGVSPRRPFDDGYWGFLDLLAGQVATAITNARAYEEEKRRAESLAELDRAKTAFFSNVSHEFRTPLTLMLGPLEDILAKPSDRLLPENRELLEVVNRNALRLLRLVNALLDFSRIEAGRVQAVYEPIDLAAFTAELASVFRSACARAGLGLVADCPPLAEPVYVDREMWEKVVLNLLSNAFKFTLDGEITVSLRQVDRATELRVRDTGTGIPAEEMPRLFERFHRVENARGRTHEGSGIGLALVQELVKLHGGSVAAESVFGRGTTFTVTLPLGAAHLPPERIGAGRNSTSAPTVASPFVEEALRWLPNNGNDPNAHSQRPTTENGIPALPPATEQASGARPRVLVADDNADMRQYVARLLAEQYTVEAVSDGEAALAAVRHRLPDLILSDVMMPRLDGVGLVRELRADPLTAGVPIVLLSARAGEESRVAGLATGADDYLVKPFSARELLARVGAIVQINRLRRESERALRKQSEQLRRLAEVAALLNAAPDVTAITRAVTEKARALIGAHQAVTGFTTDQNWGQAINAVSLSEKYARWRDYEERPDGSGIYALVCRTSAPLRLTQAELEAHPAYKRFGRHAPAHPPMRGWLAAPLVGRDGRNIGLIQLSDKYEGEFTGEDESILVQLAQMASVAIENAHLVQDLRDADRRKDEFLALLGHELRNPLAPIRNAVQLLALRSSDPAVARAGAMIDRQATQLTRLVDELLDASRIARGKVRLTVAPLDLTALVRTAVEDHRHESETAGLVVELVAPPGPLRVRGDTARLTQVVTNLLNNAAKFTPSGGRVTVKLSTTSGEAVLSITDTGVGIAAPDLPTLFEAFRQVDADVARTKGGLGLGLAVVKGLIELHGGRVGAESAGRDRGTTFTIRLPLALHAPPVPAPPARRADQVSGRRVVIVEDGADTAESLREVLELKGFAVSVATTGPDGVTLCQQEHPDAVVCDIGLPGMDGFEVARALRADRATAGAVLVAVSGYAQEDDRRKALDAGFDALLAKPADTDELVRLLIRSKT